MAANQEKALGKEVGGAAASSGGGLRDAGVEAILPVHIYDGDRCIHYRLPTASLLEASTHATGNASTLVRHGDGMCILVLRAVLCGGRSVEMPNWDEHTLDENLKHIREELSLPMEVFISQPLPLHKALLNFHFTHANTFPPKHMR